MKNPDGAMSWCWAGVAAAVLAGMALTQAEDFSSATERLVALDFGAWLDWTELGVDEIRWAFAVTPLAACWGAIGGGLCGWIAWRAQRNGDPLPFGWLGGLIWIATWGLLTAASLPLAWLFLSIQTWLAIIWLVRHRDRTASEDNLRPFLAAQVAGDVCTLTGVLLAGIAWETLDLAAIRDAEFVHAGWQRHPLLCSIADLWLILGFACRCAWFPWLPATRIVEIAASGRVALLFGGIMFPAVAWWWFVVSPLLGCAPEVVAFVQGATLLAALIAVFVATAQTDRRRTVLLLASMQFGLIVSAAVLPGVVSPWELAIVVAAFCLTTAQLLTSLSGWPGRLAWWLLAGGCLSPLYWTASASVERFADFTPPGIQTGDVADGTEVEEQFRVRPMPTATWVGAWCLTSFFAAFAARCAAAETAATSEATHHDVLPGVIATILALLAAWLAMDDILQGELWPEILAAMAGLVGWLLASSLCRDTGQIENRFSRWGMWATFSQRSSLLDEGTLAVGRRRITHWSARVRRWEDEGFSRLITHGLGSIAAWINATVEELRSEPPGVYAVAFALVVGSMIATWMWLAHGP